MRSQVAKTAKRLRPSAIRDALLERYAGGNAEPLTRREVRQLDAATRDVETAEPRPHALNSDAELEPLRDLEMRKVMELQDQALDLVFGNLERYRAIGPGEFYRDLKKDLSLLEQFFQGDLEPEPEPTRPARPRTRPLGSARRSASLPASAITAETARTPRRPVRPAPQPQPAAIVDSDEPVDDSTDSGPEETLMDDLHDMADEPAPKRTSTHTGATTRRSTSKVPPKQAKAPSGARRFVTKDFWTAPHPTGKK